MFTLVVIGLVGGLITGISPCILPVLPVVLLAGGTGKATDSDNSEEHPEPAEQALEAGGVAVATKPATTPKARRSKRPYAVIAGLVVSFSLFTLLGSLLLSSLGLPADLLRTIGVVLLVLIALGLLFPRLEEILERPFSWLPQRSTNSESSSAFVLGLGLGLLYVPCAGPVLTAITVAGATNRISANTVVLTVAFAIGATVPLLLFALAGRRMSERIAAFRRRQRTIRAVSGVVMILLAVALQFNAADAIQRLIPDYTAGLQKKVADDPALHPQLTSLADARNQQLSNCADGATELRECGPAPEFHNIAGWLNTPNNAPLRMSDLHGKVVLIDFWTYSCINCQRGLPHVEAWYRTYHDDGLEIVGVHTPEFAFERVPANVLSGAQRLGVKYPIAIDNNYSMFDSYRNQYWPADFLVDATGVGATGVGATGVGATGVGATGQVRYFKLGEGDYSTTENHIRELLRAAHPSIQLPPRTTVADQTVTDPSTTPETYLNAAQIKNYRGDQLVVNQAKQYRFPADLPTNAVSLSGIWTISYDNATAGPNARVRLHYHAKDVYMVLAGQGALTVAVNGHTTQTISISGTPRLYQLIKEPQLHDAELTVDLSPGLKAYSFTFG